jgi:hypothetical protein
MEFPAARFSRCDREALPASAAVEDRRDGERVTPLPELRRRTRRDRGGGRRSREVRTTDRQPGPADRASLQQLSSGQHDRSLPPSQRPFDAPFACDSRAYARRAGKRRHPQSTTACVWDTRFPLPVINGSSSELHRGAVGYHVTMSTLKAWIERKRWHKEPRSQGRLRAPDAPPVHEEPPARPLQAFLPPSSR